MSDLSERIKRQRVASDKERKPVHRVYPEYASCPLCHGTLYKDNGKPCYCKTKMVISKALKKCNVGDGFVDVNTDFYLEKFPRMKVRFANGLKDDAKFSGVFSVSDFVEYIQLYAKTFPKRLVDGRGFIMSGDCGGGKTSASIYIIKELCVRNYREGNKKPYSMYFMDTLGLLETIKESWDNDSPNKYEAKRILDYITEVDLLVLDDLGAEYSKSMDWLISILLKLIKGRSNNNLPTIITTNLNPNELSEKFSEKGYGRLASVLTEKFDILVLENFKDARTLKKTSLLSVMKKEV